MHRLNAGKFTPESSMNLKEFVENIYLPYTDELRASTKKRVSGNLETITSRNASGPDSFA